jgi:predicted enzyme related to lactoylglutathione lyase
MTRIRASYPLHEELLMKFWSGVVTEKVRESKDFYVRLFGCEVLFEGEGDWFVLLQLGEGEIGFMKPNIPTQARVFQAPLQGQGLWIAVDVDDADAQYERIQALGVPIDMPIRDEPWGDRHFVIVDPNGIGVDVVQHRHEVS